MAKVLRTHQTPNSELLHRVGYEIALLTRDAACPECIEILFESGLYRRLTAELAGNSEALEFTQATPTRPGLVMGFKYRVVYSPGVRPGSMAVITRTEILFK